MAYGRDKSVGRRIALTAACALFALLQTRGSQAEIFTLSSGGRIQGEFVKESDVPRQSYRIRMADGIVVTIARTEVVDVTRPRAEELEYARIRLQYADTVEGQWELAEWCRKARLSKIREQHLQRIVELDPNHERARRGLGFTRRDGRWSRTEDEMVDRGYELYKGSWMLPEKVLLLENVNKTKAAEGEWNRKFQRLKGWLGTDKARAAQQEIMQIRDPYAIKALRTALSEESNDNMRIFYLRALANIDAPAAQSAIAEWSMEEPTSEVRLTCFELLRGNRAAMDYYVGFLSSQSNPKINQAAFALRHMGDPAAIGPLIHTLKTTHDYIVTTGQKGTGGASFSDKGIGMNQGSSSKRVSRTMSNRDVLEALITLADGPNFGYDQDAWKAWWTSRTRVDDWDPRRG